MKCNLCKNVKIGVIIALCLIVVGMVFFGVFGLNKSVDSRTNYEVVVGVDQNLNQAGDKVKSTAESYFNEIGVKYFSMQVIEDGASYLYVFDENKVDAKVLEGKVQDAVGDVVVASCKITEVRPSSSNQIVKTAIALAIASVAIIIYLIFIEKVASTFTVILNSVFASILCVSLLALTRVPIFGSMEIYVVASFILSAIVSTGIVNRSREISSVVGNEKLPYSEIVNKAVIDSGVRILAFVALTLLSSIALAVMFTPHLLFTAIYVLIAGISAVFASILGTAVLWPILKSVKKKA